MGPAVKTVVALVAVVVAPLVLAVGGAVIVGLGGDGNGDSGRNAGPSATQTVTASPPQASGAQLFISVGCASCHGQSGAGGIGPALPGHTVLQVVRQVRRPLNMMPLFTADELGDDDLQRLAEFIASLPVGDAGHAANDESGTGLDPRDEISLHHWMMLSAIRAGNLEAAVAHGRQIAELVGGEHQAAMREALRALEAGELQAAEAAVVEMLAGFEPDISDLQIRSRLILQALATGDDDQAIADLGELLRLGAGAATEDIEQALDALRSGRPEQARDVIEPLTGLPGHDDEEEHGEDN